MPATVTDKDDAVERLARELAHFESVLPGYEKNASTDVAFSYKIRRQDRGEWERILGIQESLSRLRLRMAIALAMPVEMVLDSRKFLRKAGTMRRLIAMSDRLEALEDLYEGAVDRINDHRYWRDGHTLEIVIILFLALEAILIGVDLFLRFKEVP